MRAVVLHPGGRVAVEEVPTALLRRPTDAVVRVVAAGVCGSDLWRYRGVQPVSEPRQMGHEFIGVVESVGRDVATLRRGDFVVSPFNAGDGDCAACQNGVPGSCRRIGYFGGTDADGLPVDGGQGELVRVPLADSTLVATPTAPDAELLPALLALTDVAATGRYAAACAGVREGSTVVVVGDGAVGQCAVLAATHRRAGAVIVMSRHPARQELARRFGAHHVVAERGAEGVAAVRSILGPDGADAVLECVGTTASMDQAVAVTRSGGRIGYVGKPVGARLQIDRLFARSIAVHGGPAPVRTHLAEAVAEVFAGEVRPGLVFDLAVPLEAAPEAYEAMAERRALKAMVLI